MKQMKLRFAIVALLALLGVTCTVERANAAFVPFGPQNDVALATVTGTWGWTLIYRGDYSVDSVDIATAFAGAGQYVMIGAIRDDLDTIDVLAAALTTDVQTHTAQHVTHLANGSEWYYNGGSLGFAGAGDTINQGQADTNGPDERDRLSWHTNGPGGFIGEYDAAPTHIRFGWRSGDNLGLNSADNWDKLIFTLNLEPVPEPTSMVMLGIGALSLAGYGLRRRKQTSQV